MDGDARTKNVTGSRFEEDDCKRIKDTDAGLYDDNWG